MKVGFTGTHLGMTTNQITLLKDWLLINGYDNPTNPGEFISDIDEFRHGCCIGADEEAHKLVLQHTKANIVIHPPIKVYRKADIKESNRVIILEPAPFLIRDADIVDSVDILVAAPASDMEVRRSGTWSTIRYARKVGKIIIRLMRFHPQIVETKPIVNLL